MASRVDLPPCKARIRSSCAVPVLFLVLISATIAANPAPITDTTADAAFTEANILSEQGLFDEAIIAYHNLLQHDVRSAALHFNLANAFHRSGQTGHAIFHYRLAQQLAPRDPDILANIQFARAHADLDQTPPPHPWQQLILRATLDEWTILTTTAFWTSLLVLILLQLRPTLRRPLRPVIAILLPLTLIAAVALTSSWRQHHNPTAIVVVPETVVRFGPFPESQKHYTLPDGTEVQLLDHVNDWLQVTDPHGRIGWLQQQHVARLR